MHHDSLKGLRHDRSRIGAETIVVADAASVGSDASHILHEEARITGASRGKLTMNYPHCRLIARTAVGFGCVAFLLFLQVGCGQKTAALSDKHVAQKLLQETLEAWKAGGALDDQRGKKPPVYVVEDFWQDGSRLDSYSVTGEGEVVVANIRFPVTLKVRDKNGRVSERSVKYLVTTTPALTVSREER